MPLSLIANSVEERIASEPTIAAVAKASTISSGGSELPCWRPVATQQHLLRWNKTRKFQRYSRLVARLSGMGPFEILQRLRNASRKKLRSLRPVIASNCAHAKPAFPLLDLSDTELIAELRQAFDTRFFFGPGVAAELAVLLKHDLSEDAKRINDSASNIFQSRCTILGQSVRLLPGAIDWQADPKSGLRHWPNTVMDEADAISIASADIKHVWEVNRHQFLPILGRAFWLTGDERYVKRIVALVEDWINQNPCGSGVNWCSHLEVGMRAISWLWTVPHLLSWEHLSAKFLRKLLVSLAEHHRHLARNLSVYTDPTNHLIGETAALWMLSVVLPELPNAESAIVRTQDILAREIARQVTPDGVSKEQASSYQRFVLDFYLQVLVLAKRNRLELPAIVADRVEQMLEFVSSLAGPSGEAPMVGDSDDARALPVTSHPRWDFRDLLCIGALLFRRGDWKQAAGQLSEIALWLLGRASTNEYAKLPQAAVPCGSKIYADGGYCFLKAPSSIGEIEMIFDVGPLGLWPNAAHGHSDALSVCVRLGGAMIMTDPGTGAYFTNPALRDGFRSTAAHNTVTVDHLDQADVHDVFKWVNPMNVSLCESYVGVDFDYVVGAHDGYGRLKRSVQHRRAVLFVKPDTWVVIDDMIGDGTHLYTRHFNFDPAVHLRRECSNTVVAAHQVSGGVLMMEFLEATCAKPGAVHIDCEAGWSGTYGHWQNAPRIRVDSSTHGPAKLITVLRALPQMNSDLGKFEMGSVENAIVLTRGNVIDQEWLVINQARQTIALADGTTTDAELAFLRQDSEGNVKSAFLVGEQARLQAGAFAFRAASSKFTSYKR
jgi:Heparinase II/III-like protein/Heparinase II/III N-terminus